MDGKTVNFGRDFWSATPPRLSSIILKQVEDLGEVKTAWVKEIENILNSKPMQGVCCALGKYQCNDDLTLDQINENSF